MTKEQIKKQYIYNTEYILKHKLADSKLKKVGIEPLGSDEIFVQYPNWKDYYGSSQGRGISLKCGKVTLLKPSFDKENGYNSYKFTKPKRTYNGKKVKDSEKDLPITAHRLVADIFLPDFYPEINRQSKQAHHLNGDKQDNSYKNLILLPTSLHTIMNRIKKIALFKNNTFRIYSPLEIMKITGLTLEEIIKATKKKPIQSQGKYTVFQVKDNLIGFQYYPEKNLKGKS